MPVRLRRLRMNMHSGNARSSAPIRAATVKRAYEPAGFPSNRGDFGCGDRAQHGLALVRPLSGGAGLWPARFSCPEGPAVVSGVKGGPQGRRAHNAASLGAVEQSSTLDRTRSRVAEFAPVGSRKGAAKPQRRLLSLLSALTLKCQHQCHTGVPHETICASKESWIDPLEYRDSLQTRCPEYLRLHSPSVRRETSPRVQGSVLAATNLPYSDRGNAAICTLSTLRYTLIIPRSGLEINGCYRLHSDADNLPKGQATPSWKHSRSRVNEPSPVARQGLLRRRPCAGCKA